MIKPNSLKMPDDDIVRVYKENRLKDWAKQINALARVNGVPEMAIVSILERRSDDLGAAAIPRRTGNTSYGLILPTPSPDAFDQVMLQRIAAIRTKVNSMEESAKSILRSLDALEEGILENNAHNNSRKRR